MNDNPANSNDALPNEEIENLIRNLRQKQGNWVEWGQACAKLQKAGLTPQAIFEATGFEPIQQNQVIVGAQVYASIENAQISEAAKSHYTTRGSDILYELRLLAHSDRAAAADLIISQQLNVDDAREVAKAIKEYSRLPNLPEGFSQHPGDALAYHYWRLIRQKNDLQERSRLIAKGLKFAHSQGARQQIERLLLDFSVVPHRPAPRLPFYRLEADDELARIVPVVGEMPISTADFKAVPIVEDIRPFGMVKFAGEQAWVPLPGWQVALKAEDPVVILCNSDRLPEAPNPAVEPVLLVVDRSDRQWDVNNYFIVDNSGQIELQWFETQPNVILLGKIIVVVRPKKILDEEYTKEVWQIDE
ncbi:RuBisCO accumulation factor 1 [Aliterella atlantica]|uniref:RuBisCO accumulation factor 1 n=1 Tax=Aliterella atlantica CENA595 TaxID=1618023 RepID=A0A0D8ZSI2_9CYAN|nr:RuBisCO accumulation factor 1 [Aliterella atlantica]KJH71700.1 hypothetical protein UH38_11680 [Aliterella atlantica CENA595]